MKNDGVLFGLSLNKVMVDYISSYLELVKEIFVFVWERGCWVVDVFVFGGDIGVRNGNLVIFVGGDSNVINWLMLLLGILGSKVIYMGGLGIG